MTQITKKKLSAVTLKCVLQSSLFQVILRELPLSEGSLDVHGVISYASQEPWLFSGSIKQNIIFNSPIDEYRYKQVIHLNLKYGYSKIILCLISLSDVCKIGNKSMCIKK